MNWKLAVTLVMVFVLVAIGVAGFRASRRPQQFLVVVVDALRADHVGCYGSTTVRTPNMDALARRGLRYDAAYTQASWTAGANAALFTGMYPGQVLLITPEGLPWLRPEANTLAERFRAAGFATALFTSHPRITADFGFTQGFGVTRYIFDNDRRVVRECAQWLQGHSARSFFAVVYLLGPHDPYTPKRPPALPDGAPAELANGAFPNGKFGRKEITYLHSCYEGEIEDADADLGVLLADAPPRCTVALVSDHGEEWAEHGGLKHSRTLYDECSHVPLILAGQRTGVIIAPVGTFQLAPTLLRLAGLTPNEMTAPPLPPYAPAPKAVFSTLAERMGYTNCPPFHQHAIRTATDVGFRRADGTWEGATQLKPLMARHIAMNEARGGRAQVRISEQRARELRSLGYMR
ncbi:MAG: sulfatase [Armatimonadota bacterium]|nr:MAG: sulfatase [Armatimonadota bacterium]